MKTNNQSAVLVMLDRHLGNFLVASPVLRHLARQFQTAQLILHSPHAALAQRIPGLPKPHLISASRDNLWSRARLFHQTLSGIRQHRPQMVIDFGGSKTAALAGGLSRATWRICHQGAPHARLYNRHADPEALGHHRIDTYGALAAAAGHGSGWGHPSLQATEEDQADLASQGLGDAGDIVCLHVAGGKGYKHWPLEKYARIIDWLANQGLRPALIGAAPDRLAANQVLEHCQQRPLDLVEQLPIGTLIALLSQCQLFVGNDSGPMHVAAAAGSPVVALFGPTDPSRWGPLSNRTTIVRGTQAVAPGQGKSAYAEGRTMESISLDSVLAAIAQQLETNTPSLFN